MRAQARQGGDSQIVALRVLDVTIDVACPDPATAQRAERAWARCLDLDRGHDTEADLTVPLVDNDDVSLLAAVTNAGLQKATRSKVLLRAAALATPDGETIVLLGGSGSGKTTAAETLGHRWGYVTDENVAIDASGAVTPLPRPLAQEPTEGHNRELVSPDELNLLRCPPDLQLARIVLLDRLDGARPALEHLDPADGVLAIVPHSSFLASRRWPLRLLYELARQCGGVYRLTYGNIADATETLQELLDRTNPIVEPCTVLEEYPRGVGAARWGLMDGRIRRAPYRDALLVGDDLLLFIDQSPVRVQGIGITIWFAAADAPTLDEITERVIEAHGTHPEARALVVDAVAAMASTKVLGHATPQLCPPLELPSQS